MRAVTTQLCSRDGASAQVLRNFSARVETFFPVESCGGGAMSEKTYLKEVGLSDQKIILKTDHVSTPVPSVCLSDQWQ